MPLEEVPAKLRLGPPKDDDEDYALPIWAGVLPISVAIGTAEPDPKNLPGVAMPEHVRSFALGR